MSLEASKLVWRHSKHKGTKLVLMLAIADHVNADKGNVAWLGIRRLAQLTRKSERQVQRALRALKASGELQVHPNQGPHGTNLYRIWLPKNVAGDIGERILVTSPASTGDAIVTQSVKEPLRESSPIVPLGDERFWIDLCFKCFNQKPRDLSPRLVRTLKRGLPSLEKKYARALLAFYEYEPDDCKTPPYSSRRHSPERLLSDLPRQLGMAALAHPDPVEKQKPEFTIEEIRDYLTQKFGDCYLPDSIEHFENYFAFSSIRSEVYAELREKKKAGRSKTD